MPYSSIDSDEVDADDIITCISSDDEDAIAPYFTHDIVRNENDVGQDDDEDEDNSGELIEVVDDVEFVEETDALDVNSGDENCSVFAFEMF